MAKQASRIGFVTNKADAGTTNNNNIKRPMCVITVNAVLASAYRLSCKKWKGNENRCPLLLFFITKEVVSYVCTSVCGKRERVCVCERERERKREKEREREREKERETER
jgi:putative lipase involved disintegration of autophagic bodies